MGLSFALAVVRGPHASAEAVRRALWLPRIPDATCPLRELLSGSRGEDHLGLRALPGRIFVYGRAVPGLVAAWRELSRDRGQVLTLFHDAQVLHEDWAIYQNGERVRAVRRNEGPDGEAVVSESGPPHPLEPDLVEQDPDLTDRQGALHLAVAGFEVEDHDATVLVPVWRVQAPSPPAAP